MSRPSVHIRPRRHQSQLSSSASTHTSWTDDRWKSIGMDWEAIRIAQAKRPWPSVGQAASPPRQILERGHKSRKWKGIPRKQSLEICKRMSNGRSIGCELHCIRIHLFFILICQMCICMNFPRLKETLDEAKPGRVGAMSIDTTCRNRLNAGHPKLDQSTGPTDEWDGRTLSEGPYLTISDA